MAHGDPIFAQVGPKNGNFQRFQQNLFRTTGFQLTFLILIEFPNIFHWKPAKKKDKTGCGLWGKFEPNQVQCCEKKVKKQAISLGFFHILLVEYVLKQKAMVVKPPEWKVMTITARNIKFKTQAKFLPNLGQKFQKLIIFNNFALVSQS